MHGGPGGMPGGMGPPGMGPGMGGIPFQGNRRVGVGGGMPPGMPPGMADRRRSGVGSSLPLDAPGMSELLQRRGGVGFDGMESILGRRDSLDSTTAVLDACILDLTRRRISMAMGVNPNQGGPMGSSPSQGGPGSMNPSQGGPMGMPQGQGNSDMGQNNSNPNSGGPNNGQPQQQPNSMMGPGSQLSGGPSRHLHQQQQLLELEKVQKELEMQKQQILAGLQESSMPSNVPSLPMSSQPSMGQVGSMNPPMPRMNQAQQDSGVQQQWWVCQVCSVKAFASRDEAMQHELICAQANRGNMAQQQQQQQQQQQGQKQAPAPMGQHPFAAMPGMDQPDIQNSDEQIQMHGGDGPFRLLQQPLPLSMDSDKDWLTPLHCFVRENCVEVFCATTKDVATPSKGKRKPIQVGQVGIRCPHCHRANGSAGQRERGSVYYPTTISSIYNATMNLLQRHLHSCSSVPKEIMGQYQTLKADDARSGTSKKYWIESALSLGLVDTPNGIRVSARRPPPLPRLSRQQHSVEMFSARRRNSSDFFSPQSNADVSKNGDMGGASGMQQGDGSGDGSFGEDKTKAIAETAPLVTPEDKPYATEFSYHLLSQMQPCVFTEADRLGKRKGLPAGFAGLACRHCFGGYGSGRFFPSSIKTLSDTSKTLNVLHNHMMRCRKCPQEVRSTLDKLRATHDDERAKMKFGSQKAFFAKIWARLHDNGNSPMSTQGLKRKAPPQPHMMGAGGHMPQLHPGAGQMMGLDVLSRQAESMNDAKRARMGI